jgi:integrase
LRSGENPAQWRNSLDALLPPPTSIKRKKALEDPNNGHFGSMAYEDVPAFAQELSENSSLSARMVCFLILTAARTNSVRMARWDEIDLKKSQWVIPARNMKNKKPFTIPLSDEAVNLVNHLPRVSDFIFPSPADVNKPMSENAMLALVQRRMNRKDVTVHGFRTSFRTWVAEQTNYDGDLAEFALSHEVGSKVQQAYQRSSLIEKRAGMMEEWAKFVMREK